MIFTFAPTITTTAFIPQCGVDMSRGFSSWPKWQTAPCRQITFAAVAGQSPFLQFVSCWFTCLILIFLALSNWFALIFVSFLSCPCAIWTGKANDAHNSNIGIIIATTTATRLIPVELILFVFVFNSISLYL
jgi:hypothetical protein